MASINLDKVRNLYGNSTDLQGQFIDYLRNVESELDFSKFEGLDDQAIFTNLMESGQKEIKVNPNNPAKPLNYRPRREQTYKDLKVLDDEINNQPFYKDLAMRATQVLDQINPTPFRQKELETRRQKAQEILNHLKRSGVTSEQFAKEYGDSPFLREAYFENQDIFSNIFDLSHDTSAALFGGKNAQAKAYDFELESYNTYKTIAQRKLDDPNNYYKLTPKEREIIDQRLGAFSAWWHNDSNKEKVDLYLDLENAKESASNFVAAQKRLENVNSNEQFLGLIGALKHGKEFDKKQKAMIDDYAIVAKELGFDTLAYNKTGLYFIKDEKAYKVEQGLWDEIKGVFKDNIGSLAGAIAGAEYGYKKGKLKGMIAYGAAGAFGGGITDSMIADVLANKKIDLAQALIHGAQEGALNIAADTVLKVAGTAIKTLNPEKLKNIAGTAIDYTPLLGFAKRAKDGNKAAAQKLIDHAIPQEAQADLKALESIFGAEVQIGATKTSQAQNAINALQNKLGSDSYIVRGAQSLYDTFAFTSQKQAQKDFIRAIRADESGNLTAFLSEAANASPVIQKNLLNILDQTSHKLAHQLERFELPPSTIKDVFDNFEKGTKQSYTDAIEQILLKVYDESYTTTLAKDSPNIPSNLSEQEAARFNTDSLESFKAKMEKSGVMLEDSAKFLRFVESTIYNPKGVTFETLNNAQKTLNTYYKQASDPNFRSFVKDAINGFIKRDIQAGIEKIFAQNKALYNDARTLFDTALSDYAKMKETLKLADSLKIRDRRRSYDQVAQSLSRFFLGQGENIPNFEALLGSLQKELREQVELKLLQDMLELSFVKLNDSKVLDSSEFFKRLEPLKGHFHSTSAKDFIKIAQDFHTLFRNDANIAKSLSPATTEKIGTSIATTLEGAVRFQVIKALFANIIRLMPHIPFAKRLNESVQGSALRYQLKKALDSSLSVGEFKLELQARAIKADFTNATREQIAKILGQVESAQESLERAPAQPSLRADEIGEAKQGEAADSLAIHKTDIQETQAPKTKGNYNKEVLLKNAKASPYPHNADEAVKSESISSPSLEQGNPLQSHQSISDSTTKSPLEQAHAQKQAKKAEQEAAKQAQAQADQNTAQAIKDRNDQIQNLKDSRAGKSEMEREVKLGQPIAMKRTEQPPTSIATDDNNIYQLDFVIVKAHDVKPNFNADGLQPRTQKEHKTIESIAQNFKPEMVLGRGGYKDLPIIAKDGQVITGNHRVQGFKDFTPESRTAYEKAIKDRFNIELASDELLLRTPSDDLSVKELLSIAYNSNKEDIKNLGDHIYSVLGRYAPNFAKLPRQLESTSVQELKSKIARILDPSPYPNENDANLALLANTIKADKNANITEMLNAFSKLDKEDAARTLNTFTDTAGLWHILSNNAVEYGLKQLDLRPYLLGAMYKSATSQNTTRAANFKELNAQIKHILDTTDSSGSNAMLLMLPNTYDNLIADLLGASLARFMRLENPSSNLYETLKGANSGIREQLAPRLDFDIGYTAGRNIEQADIFDFIEYMIRVGGEGKEVAEAVELLPKLREKYNAFKASTTPTPPSTPTKPTLESQAGKEASTEPPAQKVETSLSQEIKDTPKKSQREQVKQQLQSIKNIDIPHKSGIVARLSSTGIDKMLSDKAIQKSLDNGFTKEQHFNAVADIERLFKNSDFSHTESPKNQSADIVGIHRYINTQDLQDQNAQALITLKESVENGNRIYSVELEGLTHPSNLDRSPKSKGVENSHHDDAGATESARLFENPSDIIPQPTQSPAQKGLFDEVDSSVAYTDTKGHTHQIPADIAQQWLKTFDLKDLQEAYTPQFSEQVAKTLESTLQGEQITLSANSLVKLMQRDRLEFLPYIKETLEHSDIIIKDKENALIFAKDIGQTSYFTSVSKNDKGEWVISTNSYKTLSQLKNRVSENGEVLYLSKEAPNILAETFTTKAFSNELASEIIPQSHTALSKQAQDHARQILQGLRKTAQTPLNKLADEVHSTDRKFMLREARYIKQQAQEFADNFANLRWQDLRAAIRYAKVPYDEAMFKELKESIESREFARFIESSYPHKPLQKSLFDTQELTPPKVDSSDLNTYTDTKGHTHQIPADIAQKWLKTFDLKDLQEAYTPQFSEQVAKALEPILQGESIKLYAGSLIKLIKENRLQYLDRIKPTLEQPQRVILQNDGALIFARDFGGEKYFTSVARNDDGEWIIRSNAPKSESGLDNKIAAGGREIYNSQAATQINAHSPYDDIAKSNTKLDSDTIPQNSLMDYALLDNNLVEVIGQKISRNYNKPYKERMSEIREFFTLPKEHFTKILDKYRREVNSLEKGEIYNKIATTMSIDEITDEITRSLKIKRGRGYAAQAEKYFNELEEKALHISKMLQDMPYQIRDFIQNSAIDYKAAQWQKLLNTLDRLITRNNERILENVQIRHKEYVEKFKNIATRNFSLWKNINALLNKEGIREVGDTLEIRNKNTLDSIFKQTTPPNTPTPPHTPKVDSNDLPLKPATAQEAQELIESITPAPMPAHLSEQEFLEGFEHFINKENFLAHLHKAQDSKQRIEALNLVEPTRKNADIELETINAKGEKTKEFIKVFEGENKRKFYVLVTQADNENFLLTGIPTTKLREIRKRIDNAKEIKARDSGVVSSAQSHNKTPTPTSDSTTKTFNQADIKLESLSDFSKFARLAGFGDLSEQELERAHKHILANLEKLRC